MKGKAAAIQRAFCKKLRTEDSKGEEQLGSERREEKKTKERFLLR
ncbi:MAG: hypothetical protein ACI8RT_000218 [Candidatus Azotimanducaceae bacterium]|jgi:hypothetical protein|tara:strand:- start:2444 stop:2578 length:135 start_codon:yes stop_codon:yes gene_type:complete